MTPENPSPICWFRIGRRPVMIFGAAGTVLCTYPLFILFGGGGAAEPVFVESLDDLEPVLRDVLADGDLSYNFV